MPGLRINFNEPSSQSKIHFADCSTCSQETTGQHTLWIENVPVDVARDWVLYGRLPHAYAAQLTAHFGHEAERYMENVKACRTCRPL